MLTAALLCLGGTFALAAGADTTPDAAAGAVTPEVQAQLASVQVPFVPNEGQINDARVKYYAKTFAGTVFVTGDGIGYNLPKGEEGGWVLKEQFAGGKALAPAPAGAPGAPVNYYLGSVEKHLSSYQEITLGEVYDKINISMRAYGNNVEKIFTVSPDGDPAKIVLKVTGTDKLTVNDLGELELATGLGTVEMTRPTAYQFVDGKRVNVEVAYMVKGDTYGFTVDEYNPAYPLVIDPLLASTFLGGTGTESGYAIALDQYGYVYVAGTTASLDFPGTAGNADSSYNNNNDIFVAKLTGDLTRLLAATYVGGGYADSFTWGHNMALDSFGNIYLAAYTTSSDFPILGGYDNTFNDTSASNDVVVIKLSGDLSRLLASTFLGGMNNDQPFGLVLDASGNVYLAGSTLSSNFPAAGGYQPTYGGGQDGFVSKLSGDLSQLLGSTYIGGDNTDQIYGIALAGGNVFIGGKTAKGTTTNYPTTTGAYDTALNNTSNVSDAVISKLSGDLTQLLASTYLGADADVDYVDGITTDAAGNVYAALHAGASFPVTSGTYQQTLKSVNEMAIVKMTGDLTALSASTFFGSTGMDNSKYIALDADRNIVIAGASSGDGLATTGAYATTRNGTGSDIVVAKFTNDLTGKLACTYFGGAGSDTLNDIALDAYGNVYLTGQPNASGYTTFPLVAGSYQTTKSGTTDAFVSKLTGDLADLAHAVADTAAPTWLGGSSLTVSNVTYSGLTLTWTPAVDNVGVSGYRIYQGDALACTVSGATYAAASGLISYSLTGLNENTTYTFGVEAVDAANNQSSGGPTASGTTLAEPDLSPPYWTGGSLTYSSLTSSGVTLTWSGAADNKGVAGYYVTGNGSVVATVYGATSCSLSNLTESTAYAFRVQAFDAAGNISVDGPGLDLTTPATSDTLLPYWTGGLVSSNFTINALSPTKMYLEWPAALDNVGVIGYNIYIKNPPSAAYYSVLATVYGTTHYTITLPDTPGISYPIMLRAFDAAGNLSGVSAELTPTPGESDGVYLIGAYLTAISGEPRVSSTGPSIEDSANVPLKPMIKLYFKNNVVAETDTGTGVWDNSTYSNKSCVTMQTAAGVNVPVNVLRIPDTADCFNERNNIFVTPVDTLAPGTQYKIIISADLMPKNKKRSMMFECVVNFTTESSASGNLAWPSGGTMTASNPTPSGATLTWTPAGAGVTSYAIIENNSDIIQAFDGSATSCDITGLTPGTTYNFQVQAFNSATNWSSPGPSATAATTVDAAAPTWTNGTLTESYVTQNSLTLNWSGAGDDAGITAYQVYQNGSVIATVYGASITTYSVTGLTAGASYTFKVEATDYAGHWSTDGLAKTVQTALAPVAAPTATPSAGAVSAGTRVTLSTTTAGAAIYYTTDGTDPSATNGTTYSGPIEITGPVTLKAVAVKDGQGSSGVLTAQYAVLVTVTGQYSLVLPDNDPAFTPGEDGGIDTMTVNSGVSGSVTFTAGVVPVTEHPGNEKAVFVLYRNGLQAGLSVTETDFDHTAPGAQATFNVQAGDLVRVFIVDNLTTNTGFNPAVLEQ